MIQFRLKPFDVLYFGAGKPFNIGAAVNSIFPPNPHTFAGGVTKLLFEPDSNLDPKLLKSVFGPFIFNGNENKFYFPAPKDIFKDKKKINRRNQNREKEFLSDPAQYKSNVGHIALAKILQKDFNLFSINNSNLATGINYFPMIFGDRELVMFNGLISNVGLSQWLEGTLPNYNEIKEFKDLDISIEPRVGIKLNYKLNAVDSENAIYRVDYLRFPDKIEFVGWIELNFEHPAVKSIGIRNEEELMNYFANKTKVMKFGGEMKTVFFELSINDFGETFDMTSGLHTINNIKKGEIVKLLLLTPGVYNSFLPNFDGLEIISIVTDGAIDLPIFQENKKGFKKILRKALSPGSVIFAKVKEPTQVQDLILKPSCGENGFIGANLLILGRYQNETVPYN